MSPPSKWVLSRVQKVDRRGNPANAHRPLRASFFFPLSLMDSAMDPGSRQQAPHIGLISNDPGARYRLDGIPSNFDKRRTSRPCHAP